MTTLRPFTLIISNLLILFVFGNCQAQSSINSAGFNVSGAIGSTTSSVGQTTNISIQSEVDFAQAAQGVQISYE